MYKNFLIAVVIPCYRVTDTVMSVISLMPSFVDHVICVDDGCPERSGRFISDNVADPRVTVCIHDDNTGVGGAVVTGYGMALKLSADIIVKIDGDGQMNPSLVENFIKPICSGEADYTKGNRFYNIEDVAQMPLRRLLGNIVLSFFNKLSSGYWRLFDPTNGYTAIHANILRALPLNKISRRYFFESDMLFRLNILRANVMDIPMTAIYGDEQSHLKISRIIPEFLKGHTINFFKRIVYNYFLRDFSIASVQLVLGVLLSLFGFFFGLSVWMTSIATDSYASTGTVMLAALPLLLGMQLFLSFTQYDISNTPNRSIHPLLTDYETEKNEARS